MRSLLFVPGNRPERFSKARLSGADAIILDLEDGVPLAEKGVARQHVRQALDEMAMGPCPVLIRINSTPDHRDEDLDLAVHPHAGGLMIPKCSSARDVLEIVHRVTKIERKKRFRPNSTRIFALIESARATIELPRIAGASRRIAALALGAEDWCLDMGIARTREGRELDFVRWSVSACAHAHGLLAIDTPFADFQDVEGLRADSESARRMGFSGKLAIHPGQVATINDAFAPSESEVAAASAIVSAFTEAEARGECVLNLGGKMVDRPIADRAREVLARARK